MAHVGRRSHEPAGDALMAIGVLRGLGVPDRQITGD